MAHLYFIYFKLLLPYKPSQYTSPSAIDSFVVANLIELFHI